VARSSPAAEPATPRTRHQTPLSPTHHCRLPLPLPRAPPPPWPQLAEPPPPSPVYQLLSTGRLPPSSPGHPHTWNLWWQQERRRRTRLDPGHDPKRARAAAPAHPPAGRSDELRLSLGPLQSGAVAATGAEPALTFYGPRLAATLDYVWVTPGALEAVGWLAMPWETPGNGYGDEEGRPVAYSAVGALRAPDEAMRTLTWLPHDRCECARCKWSGDVSEFGVCVCVGGGGFSVAARDTAKLPAICRRACHWPYLSSPGLAPA
jgi:hypothetical protein